MSTGHIQAVYVQNSLKLFCFIAEKKLAAGDIEQTKQVESPEEGYRKVDEATKGDFAFIHDAQEVRYMYYQVPLYLLV